MTAAVALQGLDKVYPDGTHALKHLDLRIEAGELMVIVGPSGCGKTTTLRVTAGLEEATKGDIYIGGRLVNSLDPRERDVAMVFQNYALYPHMTVFDNLAFPLRARGVPRAEIAARVDRTARLLELGDQLARKPRALSGGQRQRVAMGRAIIREPQVFLMDEPLSNLDARLRGEMRAEIADLQRELGVTTMYVTHDQLEAMTMGTRIAVLRDGILQQCGVPQVLYDEPDNLFVATFLGTPPMNVLNGKIERRGDALSCVVGAQRLSLDGTRPADTLRAYAEREVVVGIRVEHVTDSASAPNVQRLRGCITRSELLGAERLAHVEVATGTGVARVAARLDAHAHVTPGGAIDLFARVDRIHFFDPASGRAIR